MVVEGITIHKQIKDLMLLFMVVVVVVVDFRPVTHIHREEMVIKELLLSDIIETQLSDIFHLR